MEDKKDVVGNDVAVAYSNEKIAELKFKLEKVNKAVEEQEEINKGLNNQLNLKLSKLKDPDAYVPKKTAALEVYREVVMLKNLCMYAMITSFLIAGSAAYFVFIGAIVAGLVCMGFAVMMLKKTQRMKYLEDKYQLVRPKLFKKTQ